MDEDKKFKEQTSQQASGAQSGRAIAAGMRALTGIPCLPDMGNEGIYVTYPWAKRAPEWRVVCPGLNVEGRCRTKGCKAFGKLVYYNWGFRNNGHFDYFEHEAEIKCPMCNEFFLPMNFGYSSTWFLITGLKKDHDGAPLRRVNSEWRWASGTGVMKCKYSKDDLVLWGRLEIFVSKTKP